MRTSRKMHRWLPGVLAIALACRATPASMPRSTTSASAAPAATDDAARAALVAEVSQMLTAAARNWNRGDLDAFVGDYLDSDRTTYVGRRGLLHGRAAIRASYEHYFAPGAPHDSLAFHDLEVDPLAPGVLYVVATWVLARGDSVVGTGPTSLIMVRDGGRWRIVHDHSS